MACYRGARLYLVRVSVRKRLAALAALQWSVAGVQLHDMVLEVCLAATSRRTQLTLEDWLVTRVNQLVCLSHAITSVTLFTVNHSPHIPEWISLCAWPHQRHHSLITMHTSRTTTANFTILSVSAVLLKIEVDIRRTKRRRCLKAARSRRRRS